MEIRPYTWEGPYAEMRASTGSYHDVGLCAEVRADWMKDGERIILRSSEIVGYPESYFYDDHKRPSELGGRGQGYSHRSFQWDNGQAPDRLSVDCDIEGKGGFTLSLRCEQDVLAIELGVRNGLRGVMGPIDWHFCAIGFDCPPLGDSELTRTFLFDGERLRSLRELSGAPECEIYSVTGSGGFVPAIHKSHPRGPVDAEASVVVLESRCGRYSAALGFEQAYNIFSNPRNMCFHADPYFGTLAGQEEERQMKGRLYLSEGSATDAFERYRSDFIHE